MFYTGTHLARDPMPSMDEMLGDLEHIAASGMDLVKLQVNWATTEPEPGRLDLERFDRLIARSGELGLSVYIGFVCEHAPHWLYRRHPSCRMETRSGMRVAYEAPATLPADGKPGPCFNDPAARAAMLDWLRRATSQLGAHQNVAVWNTWQEIGYWAEGDWLIGDAVCFCPNCLAGFRRYLGESFGDIASLNAAWRTQYASFEDVVPNRSRRGCDGHAIDMAWLDFAGNRSIASILRDRADAIRSADSRRRPVFAHKAGMAIGSGMDRHYARAQDFLGFSAYPAWAPFHAWDDRASSSAFGRAESLLAETWQSLALAADYARACTDDGSTWVAELEGGPIAQNLHVGRVPDAADIRRWLFTAIAHGVTSASFWVFRSEIAAGELNGFGLLDDVGDSTARFAEAGRIARALAKEPELFAAPTCERARVAILIDDVNWRYQQANINARDWLSYSVRGWHRHCFELGFPVDFLFREDFAARAGAYRAIIVPLPLCFDDALAGELARWVHGGGHLIAEACPGRVSEYAFASRGQISAAAASLFGVRQQEYRLVREARDVRRWSFAERSWGEMIDSERLTGTGALEGAAASTQVLRTVLTCTDAEPALTTSDGRVVAARSTRGSGAAWLLGTVVGFAGTADRSVATSDLVRRLLAEAGVASAHKGRLLLRRRVTSSVEAWCLLNPTDQRVSEAVEVGPCRSLTDVFGEGVAVSSGKATVALDALDTRILLVRR